jgi:hypothetical protein
MAASELIEKNDADQVRTEDSSGRPMAPHAGKQSQDLTTRRS